MKPFIESQQSRLRPCQRKTSAADPSPAPWKTATHCSKMDPKKVFTTGLKTHMEQMMNSLPRPTTNGARSFETPLGTGGEFEAAAAREPRSTGSDTGRGKRYKTVP